jgi:O-antigen ligase
VKWLVMCVIFFDGCRDAKRVKIAAFCVFALYLALAVQVIRWVPLSFALEGDDRFSRIASKMIQNEIGYNRVTLSMMLGGASWATLALLPMFQGQWAKLGVLSAAGAITVGQALTGGRTGYASWALVGLILCVVRWRHLLPIIPVAVAAVAIFMPGVRDRMLAGLGGQQGAVVVESDQSTITSGRTVIWPYVLDKIQDNPVIGYGRLAMQRTGLTQFLIEEEDENFAHPHNAYLEQLFDGGILGFLGVIPLYAVLLWKSFRLFLDRSEPLYGVAGGMACALLLALMIGSMGGQTFYPREGAVGMWAAIGVALRLSVERLRCQANGTLLFADANTGEFAEETEEEETGSFPPGVQAQSI